MGYESRLERDQVMWLDRDQAVTGIASQPFRLRWTAEEGETRSHVPDYLAERAGGPALAESPAGVRIRRVRGCSYAVTRRDWRVMVVLDVG